MAMMAHLPPTTPGAFSFFYTLYKLPINRGPEKNTALSTNTRLDYQSLQSINLRRGAIIIEKRLLRTCAEPVDDRLFSIFAQNLACFSDSRVLFVVFFWIVRECVNKITLSVHSRTGGNLYLIIIGRLTTNQYIDN